MNRPFYQIAASLSKAALKTHALQTLSRGPLTRAGAKRLECVRFIGAFRPARDGRRFTMVTVMLNGVSSHLRKLDRAWLTAHF